MKTVAQRLSSQKNQINMTEGSIFGKLLKFSLPLIFSSVLQLFFNAADVIVVGRFAGDNSLAAVGSTGSLVNLLINLFTGLATGTSVVAANYFVFKPAGAGQSRRNAVCATPLMLKRVNYIKSSD